MVSKLEMVALIEVPMRVYCSAALLLHSPRDLGTWMYWAVVLIAQCPNKLCSRMPKQMRRPRESLCPDQVKQEE